MRRLISCGIPRASLFAGRLCADCAQPPLDPAACPFPETWPAWLERTWPVEDEGGVLGHRRSGRRCLRRGGLLLAGASSALGAASPPFALDTPPAACTVNYMPGSGCLVQTRLGTFSLSTHVARPGETVTGTISPGCVIGYGNNSPCPMNWKGYGLTELGKIVSGCSEHEYSCTVKIPEGASSTSAYDVVFIGITNAQGEGYSSDYIAIIGKDKAVIEGKILDNESQGLADAKVDAQGDGGHYSVETGANGSYVIEVKAGSYRVTPSVATPKPPRFTPAGAERTVQAGDTVHADFAVDLPSLSVTDVSPGSTPLDVDVGFALRRRRDRASGCDPKATYSFTDPASVTSTIAWATAATS